MKINSKGFLLAETIVTVCIIAALATFMYLYVSKTASRFEERDNYENVVDVYKANTLRQKLDSLGHLTEDYFGRLEDYDFLELSSALKISAAYLIPNTNDGKNYIDTTYDQALKDYVDWLKIEDNDDELRLIVWFYEDTDTFANLVIPK